MGIRHYVEDAGRSARRRGFTLLLISAAAILAAVLCAEAGERRAAQALDYHATVLNGSIVGSAFLLHRGIAVTNAHVVRGLERGEKVRLVASGGAGESTDGKLIAVSRRMDMALLAVHDAFLPQTAREDARPFVGLRVVSAGVDAGGNAWPVPRLNVAGTVLVPHANVSAFGPGLVARLPGVRPGFSGGPLMDGRGRLLGMVTAIRPASGTRAVGASSLALERARPAAVEEAYVLRISAIRAEAARLLGR